MKVRLFRTADVDFVQRMLVAACFPPAPSLPTASEAREFPHAARWLSPPPNDSDIIAVADHSRTGLLGAAVARRWPHAPLELAMAVDKGFRGEGVGGALLKGWLGLVAAAGESECRLTVSLRNTAAMHLFARAGFREVRRDGHLVTMVVRIGR